MDHKIALPKLPDNTMRMRQILSNPNFQMSELAAPLNSNPEMAAVILKAANSSQFYGTEPVKTTADAVVRLGSIHVTSLLMTHSLKGIILSGSLPSKQLVRDLWDDNLKIAALCSAIAERIAHSHYKKTATPHANNTAINKKNPFNKDQALLAGVLYHIGTLILLGYIFERHLPAPSFEDIASIPEATATGVAVVLARSWELDEDLVNCARHRNGFEDYRAGPVCLQDLLDLAVVMHRHHHKKESHIPSLSECHAFKKLEQQGLITETPEHFIQMIETHGTLILRSIRGS